MSSIAPGTPAAGTLKLTKGSGADRQTYLIAIHRDPDASLPDQFKVVTRADETPEKVRNDLKSRDRVLKLIRHVQRDGYEIATVNNKPFVLNDPDEALKLLFNGAAWDGLPTAQPAQRIKPRDVEVTFDAGQFAPIW